MQKIAQCFNLLFCLGFNVFGHIEIEDFSMNDVPRIMEIAISNL